jgi:hypothetical protein
VSTKSSGFGAGRRRPGSRGETRAALDGPGAAMARGGDGSARRGAVEQMRRRFRAWGRGAENAWELLAKGRLSEPYRAPFDVALTEGVLSLRHYHRPEGAEPAGAALLLVPPLMVTADVYDISPELSAVASLSAQGVDVWVADFGAPEHAEGGMDRTLDDHVLAVDRAITEVAARTGGPVHLGGYSQGGMFAYQAAALRHCRDIASVITLGSPVDMRRNLPFRLDDTLAERFFSALGQGLAGALDRIDGLPGTLTSTGFKLLSPRQELKHLFGTLGVLHDRAALERTEPQRRFLGGEGFIGWPGPAFREFALQFVVQNRMRSGGFVIAGRTVSLADIYLPDPVLRRHPRRLRPPRLRARHRARRAPRRRLVYPRGRGPLRPRRRLPCPDPDLARRGRVDPLEGRPRAHPDGAHCQPARAPHARRRPRLPVRRAGPARRDRPLAHPRRRLPRAHGPRLRRALAAPAPRPPARPRRPLPRQHRCHPPRAGPRHPRRDLLSLGEPRLHLRAGRPPREPARPRPARPRRAPRPPRGRADGQPPRLLDRRHGAQPHRRGGRAPQRRRARRLPRPRHRRRRRRRHARGPAAHRARPRRRARAADLGARRHLRPGARPGPRPRPRPPPPH